MKEEELLFDHLKKYTRDFVVVDKSQAFNIGLSTEFFVNLEPDEIVASYKFDDGTVKVFWGKKDTRITIHGNSCILLTECENGSEDLLLFEDDYGICGACPVWYGSHYVHN